MRIDWIRALPGPNIYHHRPMLLMRLLLDDLTERESCDRPGFVDRLLETLPGLRQHCCSRGRPGCFVERLREGTYFGHVVEHVALELSEAAGIGVNHGKTRYAGEPGCYHVAVRYENEAGMTHLLRTAVELVDALVRGEAYALEPEIEAARRLAARTALGPSTGAIVREAERRGIPCTRLNEASLVQLGWGRRRRLIQAAMTDGTSAVGMEVASDKQLTKALLARAGVPVPDGCIVETASAAVAALAEIGGPVAVKPLDACQGKGVSLEICDAAAAQIAFAHAAEHSRRVLVEEQFHGRDYRALVVGGRLVAAAERTPPEVVGDGRHTIAELIAIENRDPRRGDDHDNILTRIEPDAIMLAYLDRSGRALSDVPAAGETVRLRESANLSTGGTAADVTDAVHPEVRLVCERAARALGLDLCGVDLVLEDIARPLSEQRGGVIEVNAAPGLRMHLAPSRGAARDVAGAIVDLLYPAPETGRIPLIAVTGTNGKTTTTRMIGHVIAATGATVGMTTTSGIWIGGQLVQRGDTTGPKSAAVVLSDPTVEVAVLETARGGIVRGGLAWDWCDVGVITNVELDHVGQNGIESLEDIAHIKALVAERVRPGGTLVLNADDEQVARLADNHFVRREPRRIVYFTLQADHALVERHRRAGGTAYFVKDGWIVEGAGPATQRIMRVADIPATLAGTADFAVANALAGIAACRAHGLAIEAVAGPLRDFGASPATQNAGRLNIYRVGAGFVVLDYGHNPHAFQAVTRMAARWGAARLTGIVTVPGDRADRLIGEAGRVAARGFDRLVVREDDDRRGRAPGMVARLLLGAIRDEAPGLECLLVLDECRSLEAALDTLFPGEVVVMFYDRLDAVEATLARRGAVPATVHDILAANAAAPPERLIERAAGTGH